MPESTRLFQEAQSAARVVERQHARNAAAVQALARRLRQQPPGFVATCARGSSDHAATYGKYLIELAVGRVTASASPSLNSVYAVRQHLEGALFLAISQSGRSPDLLQAVQAARHQGALVVALVNVEDSPLAALADVVIPLSAGEETSVAASKSFIATLAALAQLAAHWSQDTRLLDALEHLPETLAQAFAQEWTPLVQRFREARNGFVLGRGLGLGIAQEAALKFKETCALHAEAFSAAEVRHGPMTLVGPGFPVLCLGQADETLPGLLAVAREFAQRGAPVFVAAPGEPGPGHLPVAVAIHPALQPISTIASFYRAVNALAVARGRNPDLPPHLDKVTETV